MDERGRIPLVQLRDVVADDIEVFYEQQLDDDATAMAAFPSRNHTDHIAHWQRILADDDKIAKAIVVDGDVAGNVGSWTQDGHREVGYWLGKPYWGRGIATAALLQLLVIVEERPLFAWVVRHNTASIRVLEKTGFVYDRTDGDYLVYRIG